VLGELVPAREHLEQAITLYIPQQHRSYAVYGQGLRVTSLSHAAHALWCLGHPDQALKKSCEAVALAQELSHPYTLAYALHPAAMPHQLRREGWAVKERAEAEIALATEQRFTLWVAYGTITRGWTLTEQGRGEEGIAQICQGLAVYRTIRAEVLQPYFLALLAEAHGKVGRQRKG
jgi:predicted ATPase